MTVPGRRTRKGFPEHRPSSNRRFHLMKTISCPPKVIIHRLGAVPPPRRRFHPAGIVVLLLLAGLTASAVRACFPGPADRTWHAALSW
jgi:hypothetical protein